MATLLPSDRRALDRLLDQSEVVLRRTLGTHAADGVALLDFPSYQNAGDALIWAGERAHLDALGVPVRYIADQARFDRRTLERLLPSDAPVLLTGGGNFGDLWPDFQEHRERVVTALPGHPVVQLSQSLFFEDASNARRANAVFGRHRDFTLLVRESESLARARTQLPDVHVELCPDMAFGLGRRHLTSAAQPSGDLLLLRRDKEGAGHGIELDRLPGTRVDWGLTGLASVAWKAVRVPGRLHREAAGRMPTQAYPLLVAGYTAMGALNHRAALRLIGSARRLVTDRLHAHVLAVLLGVPHVVLDNHYGKVGALYREHTHTFSTATYAGSAAEAAEAFAALG